MNAYEIEYDESDSSVGPRGYFTPDKRTIVVERDIAAAIKLLVTNQQYGVSITPKAARLVGSCSLSLIEHVVRSNDLQYSPPPAATRPQRSRADLLNVVADLRATLDGGLITTETADRILDLVALTIETAIPQPSTEPFGLFHLDVIEESLKEAGEDPAVLHPAPANNPTA